MELVEMGVIRTAPGEGIAARLGRIHGSLIEVVRELKPDVIVLEKLYSHYKHPATAILMGHARGVVCLVSGSERVPLASLPSTHVKKSVTGHGHASKEQIQRMVQNLLNLKSVPEPCDAADALAIAITYARTLKRGAKPSRDAAKQGMRS
ncbi:MAG: hypothetical protein A3D28_03465 [Omnitrophica bacterium RIFCSPHIGHO2_02_FULL_63_14]|nr:MAG: hypothetical protein A3D28_03465 [Omnitrophica bacterium RIFCSPHIGHO2_02_FULL_63_14]